MMRFIVLFLALSAWLNAIPYFATQAGAGNNDGLSLGNAKSAAQIAVFSLSPGDTVSINGTWTSTLVVSSSGSSGNPIVYTYASGAKSSKAAWTVVYNGNVSTSAIYATGKSYFTIDGGVNGIVECTDNGDSGSGKGSSTQAGGTSFVTCSNFEVKNLTIQNIYIHTQNTSNDPAIGVYSTWGIFTDNCSTFLIHNNTIDNAYEAIYIRGTTSGTYSGCQFYSNTLAACSTAVVVGAGGTGVNINSPLIYLNDLTMGANWDDPAGTNHIDGIHTFQPTGILTTPQIYSNYIHGDCGTHCTGYIFVEGATVPVVYNNLLVATTNKPAEAFIDLSSDGGTSRCYNNTIVGLGTSSGGGIGIVYYSSGVTASLINNIFVNLYVGISKGSSSVTFASNYNDFFNLGQVGYDAATGFKVTLANWQSFTSGDANSIATDPALTGTYSILNTSPCYNAGTSTSPYVTTDRLGTLRPQSTAYDIGQFEVVVGGGSTFSSSLSGKISLLGKATAK